MNINYVGVRWKLFSDLAANLNPDLQNYGSRWHEDGSWDDLRQAMQIPRIDAPVQAVAYMTGTSFASTRALALKSVEDIAVCRRTDTSRRAMLNALVSVDPLLAPWFLVNELLCGCDVILANAGPRQSLRLVSGYVNDAVLVAKSYAIRMIRAFSMTADAAKKEAMSLRQHIGGYSSRQYAREAAARFRDEFHGDATRQSSWPRSQIGETMCNWTIRVIVALSDAWDFDEQIVDQVQTWEPTASQLSRDGMMTNIVTSVDADPVASAIKTDLQSVRRSDEYVETYPSFVLALGEQAERCGIEAIAAYPPTAMLPGSGSAKSASKTMLSMISGVAAGASVVFALNRPR